MSNTKVYFDVNTIEGEPSGRVVIELFLDIHPRMAINFRFLLTGLFFKGSRLIFDRNTDSYLVGGYASGVPEVLDFSDDNFVAKYDRGPGAVTMLPNRITFYIFPSDAPVDPHMVVGRVVEGLDVIINASESGLFISDSGQIPEPGVSKRPREEVEELARMMLNSNRGLSYIRKAIGKVKEPLLKVNATEFRKKRLGELEEMAKYVRHNLEVLNGLEADVTSMKEHQGEILGEMDLKISKLKEGKAILEAIPSLPDEALNDIESAIKKLKSDCSK